MHEHEADGAGSNDGYGIARLGLAFIKTVHYAGQRFCKGGVFEGNAGRNAKGIFGDDAGWYEEVFRIGAVVEDKAIAEVFLIMAAVVAVAAGRGVEGDNAIAGTKGGDAAANLMDGAGEFMSEGDRGLEHARVIATAIDLKVCAAGERGMDADDDFASPRLRHRNLLDTQVLAPVKDGGCHLRCHLTIVSKIRVYG
jgi:hypothetical protein